MTVFTFVNTLERIKQERYILFFDPHSGIRDGNRQFSRLLIYILTLNTKLYMSLLGILHCIVQKIYDKLLYAYLVTIEDGRHFRINTHFKSQTLFMCLVPDHVHYLRQHITHIIIDRYYIHASGFYLRKIQDVIYKSQQQFACSLYAVCIPYNIIRSAFVTEDQLVKSEYGIDGRTYLMTHT